MLSGTNTYYSDGFGCEVDRLATQNAYSQSSAFWLWSLRSAQTRTIDMMKKRCKYFSQTRQANTPRPATLSSGLERAGRTIADDRARSPCSVCVCVRHAVRVGLPAVCHRCGRKVSTACKMPRPPPKKSYTHRQKGTKIVHAYTFIQYRASRQSVESLEFGDVC